MKTLLAAAGIAALLLAGCSAAGTPAESGQTPATSASAPETASAPAEGSDRKYAVTIDGSRMTKDYEGKPTLVVDFTFQNNSDKASSFLVAVSAKAFQNGVQLESAIVGDDKKFDSGAPLKEIKPGASLKVQSAYVLADKADVTVEVSESFSFDESLIATKTFAVK